LAKNGNFKRLRVYDNNRHPVIDIDNHTHKNIKGLHVHFWKGVRENNTQKLAGKKRRNMLKYSGRPG
jgi:hypothetical protein